MAWNGRPRNDEAAFWARVSPEPTTGCWLWTGPFFTNGYGAFLFRGRQWRAHRLAFRFTHGHEAARQLNHRCDQPTCVNPAHLREGTQLENMRERLARGRCVVPRGEAHYKAKLSAADVRVIRVDPGTQRALAARFGVNPTTIGRIRNGERRKAG